MLIIAAIGVALVKVVVLVAVVVVMLVVFVVASETTREAAIGVIV